MKGKILKLALEKEAKLFLMETNLPNENEQSLNEFFSIFLSEIEGEKELSLEELYKLIISYFDKDETSKVLYYDGNISYDFPEIALVKAQEMLIISKNIRIKYKVDFSKKSERELNNLFVFLDMLSRLNAIDFEIYEDKLKNYSKFAIPHVLMGYGKLSEEKEEIKYCICQDNQLINEVCYDLSQDFSSLNKLYGLADGVDSIIEMIEESKGEDPILYLPYIYLYLADKELIQAMSDQGLISSQDYTYWQTLSKLCNHEKLRDIKLVVSQTAWENTMKGDWVKLSTGFAKIEDFGNFAPIIRKNINNKLMKDNLYIRNDKDGESRKLPNVILYSDTENSFAIRTNMGSHKGIDRVFNKTYDKKMAKCLYSYLNRLYNGNSVFNNDKSILA